MYIRVSLLFLLAFVNFNTYISTYSQCGPLPNAYAHNDYWHNRPLYDALEKGFTHIEADIFLKNGHLVVAHTYPLYTNNRTLENLYLQPLQEYIEAHGNQIFAGYNCPLTLMIDIKSDANKTYRALAPILEKYKTILTSCEGDKVTYRQVSIVLTGNKPSRLVRNQENRFVFIDDDLKNMVADNLQARQNVSLTASCKYSSVLKWKGKGQLPKAQKDSLCAYVRSAHEGGKKVRLWASPEKEEV